MAGKNKTWLILMIFGLLTGLIFSWPDKNLHVIACDVGQGDAILLTKGFSQVLVDGGPNDKVLNCLSKYMPFWDKNLEIVVATHPDKDHIGGLAKVIERYNLTSFVSINEANNTTTFANLQRAVWQKDVPVHIAQKGDKIKIDDLQITVLSPQKSGKNYLVWNQDVASEPVLGDKTANPKVSNNDQSVVLLADFNNFEVLLTGDISQAVEKKLVEEDDLSQVEVLKVSHHGSKYGTSQEILEEMKPKVALIGVGKNQWGHPTDEVLSRLKKFGVKIFRTDIKESIEIISDGQSWWTSGQ